MTSFLHDYSQVKIKQVLQSGFGGRGKVECAGVELTERRSQPGNFPKSEAFRILSLLTSQSSPDKASPALRVPPAFRKYKFSSEIYYLEEKIEIN